MTKAEKHKAQSRRRTLACVTACYGISTEALESGIVKERQEVCKAVFDAPGEMRGDASRNLTLLPDIPVRLRALITKIEKG